MANPIKIYTKSGDKGETSLVGGSRLFKSDPQINLYGEVDHLNSFIGLAITSTFSDELKEELYHIQNVLFDLGSLLACEADKREDYKLPKLKKETISKLENSIDKMQQALPELKNFILPGGSLSASHLHLCRTQARKVERLLVESHQKKQSITPELSLEFINRLSDYLFVAARFCNHLEGSTEKAWEKQT